MRSARNLFFLTLALALFAVAPACGQAAPDAAPQNFAPNSQWEIWSGTDYGTAENIEGTGTAAVLPASANTTGTAGSTTFTVASTGQLRVGDLVVVSGAGVDAALRLAPMRVTGLVANSSITVRLPLGLTPTVDQPASIRPIVVGNLAAVGTGDAADRWKKTTSLPIWRETHGENIPAGAYYSMGLQKDAASPEAVWTAPDIRLYAGKTVVFGMNVYQKNRRGRGTWSIYWNAGTIIPCSAMPASAGWQWQECSFRVPADAGFLNVGVRLDGDAGDTYYLANPVFSVGSAIGGAGNYTKPQEIFLPIVHISPFSWVNAAMTFPATPTDGIYSFTVDPYAETGGKIAPSVAQAWGQLEGIDGGAVQEGTGHVRVMAWYDRVAAPERSGSFLPQYVRNVKSFMYMDMPLNSTDASPDLIGTAVLETAVASDHWSNVSLEFDRFLLR